MVRFTLTIFMLKTTLPVASFWTVWEMTTSTSRNVVLSLLGTEEGLFRRFELAMTGQIDSNRLVLRKAFTLFTFTGSIIHQYYQR